MDGRLRENLKLSEKCFIKILSLCLLKDKNVVKRGATELSELTLHRFGLAPDRTLATLTSPYLWQVLNTFLRQHL